MIKKKGRLLLGVLCLCSMVVSYTPMYVNAQENIDRNSDENVEDYYSEDLLLADYTSGDYTYTTGDGGIVIKEYNGTASNVVIPATLDGKDVKTIGSYAFSGNNNLQSVVIPDSVLKINMEAFYNCSKLSYVDLGNSVENLGYTCFRNCDSLESITIPKSMTMPTASANNPFSGCDLLKTINIEEGGTIIPANLFSSCKALQNITIPNGIKEIGSYAFSACESLSKIVIPCSVEKLDMNAFYNCKKLNEFYNYSPDAKYGYMSLSDDPYVTIHGFTGSTSQEYATKNNIPFVALPDTPMYRLYNPNSTEHLYTDNSGEKDWLAATGWNYEGVAWIAPQGASKPVYRLYNPYSGEHHFTTDEGERGYLITIGWNDEGIGWKSHNSGIPVYRLFNPNNPGAGSHHYTTDAGEKDYLETVGWNYEGIAWYGM